MSLPTTDRTKLNNLSPNLVPQQIAVSALRLAVFQEIYTYLDNIITDLNAAQATGAVTTAKLADGGVSTVKLADNAVTGAKLLDAAVIASKLADGSVTTQKVGDGAVVTIKLADGAVVTAKIADLNITSGKIADNAVISVKLADGAVLSAKIADGAVTSLKIADGGVTGAKIADNTITTQKLVDSIITAAKILDGSVTNAKLAPGSVTGDKVANGAINSQHMDAALLAASASLSTQAEFDKRGVNVQKYGAKGDGFTDDTAAIQAAVNTRQPLFFPPGNYIVSAKITATQQLIIIGAGINVCSIKQITKGLDLLNIKGDYSHISNMTLKGTGVGYTVGDIGTGRLINGEADYLTVDNCNIVDADYLGIGTSPGNMECKITRCSFVNIYAEAIACRGNKTIIANNLFRDIKYNAIVPRGALDTNIYGNTFENVGVIGMDATIDIRNSFDATPIPCERMSIHNNQFINCYTPVHSLSENGMTHKYIVATNNTFYVSGIATADNYIGLNTVENADFNDNTIISGGNVRALYVGTNSINAGISRNKFFNVVAGLECSVDGTIRADENTFNNVTGTAMVLRGATARNTMSVCENIFDGVGTGVNPAGSFLGNLTLNDNMFKSVITMGVVIANNITRLASVGNIFVNGKAKAFQVTSIPDLWVKGKNIGYDAEFGIAADRPPNPTIGQPYFDTTLGKRIEWNGTVWVDGTSIQVWTPSKAYVVNDIVNTGANQYKCTTAGTSNNTMPTHTAGSAANGTVIWDFVKAVA